MVRNRLTAAIAVLGALLAASMPGVAAAPAETRLRWGQWVNSEFRLFTMSRDAPADVERMPKGSFGNGAVSSDGTRVLGTSYVGERRFLGIGTPDGELIARLAAAATGGSWSADGKTVLYERDYHLWLMDPDGANKRRITPDGFYASSASLSPDGKHIVFSRFQASPRSTSLYVIRSDGSDALNPRQLTTATEGAYDESPRWSPDGASVVFTRQVTDGQTATYSVHAIAADGTDERELATGRYANAPVWSPIGDQVAFTMRKDGATNIFIVGVDGTGLVQVTDTPAAEYNLEWAVVPACSRQGTPGDDVLEGTNGDDVICGHEGADRVIASAGSDIFLGGRGIDKIDYRGAAGPVEADFRSTVARANGNATRLYGVEGVWGTARDDVIFGHDGRSVLVGNDGDDALIGRDGDDTLTGGDGNDVLRPGADGDDSNGGAGRDTVSFIDAADRVRVNLGEGFAFGQGQDILVGIEKVVGSPYDDFIVGSDGGNVLRGGDGEDNLDGQDGPDDVYGGDDRDFLFGRGGADDLYGDGGRDYIDGGADDDDCYSGAQEARC